MNLQMHQNNKFNSPNEPKQRPHFHKRDCSSVFNCRPKPISYIKGDTVCINEITEDTLNCKGSMYFGVEMCQDVGSNVSMVNTEIKKSASDNQLDEIYKKGTVAYQEDLNFHSHIIDVDMNMEPTSLINRYPHSNLKMENIGWESKSDGEDEQVNHHAHNHNPTINLKRRKTEQFMPNIFDIGRKCENMKDAFIFSWTQFHPFSFLTGVTKFGKNHKGLLNYPSPTFIETLEWQKKPDLSKKAILEGMEVHDKDGLVLVDKEITKKFRGIVSDMIAQIIKAAFGTPISLKVQMFEPKSTLQRITDYWSFAPQFLKKAASIEDPIERMKLVIAFGVSGLYIPTKQLKPFNPNIGETFQGEFEDGSKIYAEHISHYPTLAKFLIISEDYKLHGHFDFTTETHSFGSKLSVHQKGPITIEFTKLKQTVVYNMPTIKLLNAKNEEGRSAIWYNAMVFSDVQNNLKGIVKFATDKNYMHGFEGYVIEHNFALKISGSIHEKYNHAKEVTEANEAKLDYENKKMKNKIYTKVTGSWLSNCKFDRDTYWDINSNLPNWIRPVTNVLPSDGRFREDLIWLHRSFNATQEHERKIFQDFAQGWKVTIEQTQRSEREIKKRARLKKK